MTDRRQVQVLLDLARVHVGHKRPLAAYRALSALLRRDDLADSGRRKIIELRERLELPAEARADPDGHIQRLLAGAGDGPDRRVRPRVGPRDLEEPIEAAADSLPASSSDLFEALNHDESGERAGSAPAKESATSASFNAAFDDLQTEIAQQSERLEALRADMIARTSRRLEAYEDRATVHEVTQARDLAQDVGRRVETLGIELKKSQRRFSGLLAFAVLQTVLLVLLLWFGPLIFAPNTRRNATAPLDAPGGSAGKQRPESNREARTSAGKTPAHNAPSSTKNNPGEGSDTAIEPGGAAPTARDGNNAANPRDGNSAADPRDGNTAISPVVSSGLKPAATPGEAPADAGSNANSGSGNSALSAHAPPAAGPGTSWTLVLYSTTARRTIGADKGFAPRARDVEPFEEFRLDVRSRDVTSVVPLRFVYRDGWVRSERLDLSAGGAPNLALSGPRTFPAASPAGVRSFSQDLESGEFTFLVLSSLDEMDFKVVDDFRRSVARRMRDERDGWRAQARIFEEERGDLAGVDMSSVWVRVPPARPRGRIIERPASPGDGPRVRWDLTYRSPDGNEVFFRGGLSPGFAPVPVSRGASYRMTLKAWGIAASKQADLVSLIEFRLLRGADGVSVYRLSPPEDELDKKVSRRLQGVAFVEPDPARIGSEYYRETARPGDEVLHVAVLAVGEKSLSLDAWDRWARDYSREVENLKSLSDAPRVMPVVPANQPPHTVEFAWIRVP